MPKMVTPHSTLTLEIAALFIDNRVEGHATVKMDEVRQLDATYFAICPAVGANQPTRQDLHPVVRTPNGKDLLRQHYLQRHCR
ncbi:MAG TPA: hypothetical protein VFK65_13235 [Candidatus Binatia bacterium]|nr:hypothetical protein [Candidatus Binatia bacterium]